MRTYTVHFSITVKIWGEATLDRVNAALARARDAVMLTFPTAVFEHCSAEIVGVDGREEPDES